MHWEKIMVENEEKTQSKKQILQAGISLLKESKQYIISNPKLSSILSIKARNLLVNVKKTKKETQKSKMFNIETH